MYTIDVGTGFEKGISFPSDSMLDYIHEALQKIYAEVAGRDVFCYFLLHDEKAQQSKSFRPLAKMLAASGERIIVLPDEIPLDYLVDNTWEWPIARASQSQLRILGGVHKLSEAVQEFLKTVKWHAQIRAVTDGKFIGYFKIAGIGDEPFIDKRHLQSIYYSTKVLIDTLVERQRLLSLEFKQRIAVCRQAILHTGCKNPITALVHVADMLTSHLGASWNRAAFFGPVAGPHLECLWAQGGIGNREWTLVQESVARRYRSMEEMARIRTEPVDDPYYVHAVTEGPLRIHNVNDPSNINLLAQLWRKGGDVAGLPPEVQDWDLSDVVLSRQKSAKRQTFDVPSAVAARLRENDAVAEYGRNDFVKAGVFASLNRYYWILPWVLRSQPIGFWVTDMAYWSDLGPSNVGAPSRVVTRAILDKLASAFRDKLKNNGFWR